MFSMASDVRWLVSYAADLTSAHTLSFGDGEIRLRHDTLQIALIDERG